MTVHITLIYVVYYIILYNNSFFDVFVPPDDTTMMCAVLPRFLSAAGNSEDSDYTSDFNYPICQQQANSSASQFRNLADQLEMSPCSSPEHPNTTSAYIYIYNTSVR